jgi:hypothetical protein
MERCPAFAFRKTYDAVSRQAVTFRPKSEAIGHAFRRTGHPPRMPPSTYPSAHKRQPCNRGRFASMIGNVICRKSWLLVVILMSATLGLCGLTVSGCSFGDQDNVGAVGDAAVAAPVSTPQVPESMKTNDFGNGPQGPPQGL